MPGFETRWLQQPFNNLDWDLMETEESEKGYVEVIEKLTRR